MRKRDGRSYSFFHEVRFGRVCSAGWHREGYLRLLACPFEHAEDKPAVVLGFFYRGQNHVLRSDGQIGVLGGQTASMRFHLHGFQAVVVFVTGTFGASLLPRSGVRIEGVTEVMVA